MASSCSVYSSRRLSPTTCCSTSSRSRRPRRAAGTVAALLERADRDARELGLSELRLCTNESMTENLEFYPRRGFHETSRGVQDGFHRVFFAKLL